MIRAGRHGGRKGETFPARTQGHARRVRSFLFPATFQDYQGARSCLLASSDDRAQVFVPAVSEPVRTSHPSGSRLPSGASPDDAPGRHGGLRKTSVPYFRGMGVATVFPWHRRVLQASCRAIAEHYNRLQANSRRPTGRAHFCNTISLGADQDPPGG